MTRKASDYLINSGTRAIKVMDARLVYNLKNRM